MQQQTPPQPLDPEQPISAQRRRPPPQARPLVTPAEPKTEAPLPVLVDPKRKALALVQQAKSVMKLDAEKALRLLDEAISLDAANPAAFAARAEAKARTRRTLAEISRDMAAAADLDPSYKMTYEQLLVSVGLISSAANTPAETTGAATAAPSGRWPSMWTRFTQGKDSKVLWGAAALILLLGGAAGVALWLKLKESVRPEDPG